MQLIPLCIKCPSYFRNRRLAWFKNAFLKNLMEPIEISKLSSPSLGAVCHLFCASNSTLCCTDKRAKEERNSMQLLLRSRVGCIRRDCEKQYRRQRRGQSKYILGNKQRKKNGTAVFKKWQELKEVGTASSVFSFCGLHSKRNTCSSQVRMWLLFILL